MLYVNKLNCRPLRNATHLSLIYAYFRTWEHINDKCAALRKYI